MRSGTPTTTMMQTLPLIRDGDSDGDRSSDGKLRRTTSNGVTVSWLSCGYNACQDSQRLGSIPP